MGIATFAVVDLETTGNQLDYDEIIQIGITFVRQNQVIDTYHSMIRTDLEIPPFIQALTSIEEEMLVQAPYFNEVADDIYQLIKDCVFVAHNISFDLNFIKKAFEKCNIQFKPKRVMDTLELFKIAFPTDKSYQLSALAESHHIPLNNAHRADEDATTTAKLMIKAFEKFEQLHLDTQKQLYYLSKNLKYDLYHILFEMVRNYQTKPPNNQFEQFEQIIYRKQIDLKKPAVNFDGTLKDLYKNVTQSLNLTYRPQQLYLAEIILDQLMHSDKAMIEAPLGSGKSLAYLLAATMYNIETGRHVMISTNTKLLQSQLLEKDIPLLNDVLDFKINASLIKSKNDYISLGLISQILKDDTNNYEVSILKMQLLIWITETNTGDIQELNLKGGQKMYVDQKIETYVPVRHDIHYYNYIKRNAQNIQIGITNHAHLIHSDSENTIYQLFDDCIIDEAHRLPDYALNQVTNDLNYSDVKYQLGLIGKNENEKLLKAVDKLEQQRILEKLDIAPIDVFGLKININELHDLNEQLYIDFNTFEISTPLTSSNHTNVFVPNDVETYNYKNLDDYVASIVDYIVEYITVTQSKCLVLFTSYKMMHMVQDLLNELPELEDYVILTQQQNQNYKIVQQFNNFDKSILLGTSTFFEGFDFQANGLKCVMIAKLPFMNKHNIKYWLMDSEFTSTFKDYVLPDAVTRFRQGLGRLIRHEDDKGLIVSFDDRLVNSTYKSFFAQSLEHFKQRKGNIKQFNKLLNQIQRSIDNESKS
ncbi:helicase C-terminal domain-containing protein [Staphylococcus epidermidis]|nr:helicase C-terminal domain-containing protein [Staphylococcus epidermidis]